MKILVTDGNSRPALAICRSLGRKGYKVIVGHSAAYSLASASKYCSEKCIYPDPATQPEEFIHFICDYIEYKKIDILFPVTDITTLPLAENIKLLPSHCVLPFADFDSVKRAADKVGIIKLAQSLGVDVPESQVISSVVDFDVTNTNFEYPVVIKPAKSRVMTDTGWLYTSVTYADSADDLTNQLNELDSRVFPVLIQERIHGPGLGIFMCYQHGKPVAAFSHKRIREKPPSGGVSVLRESIDLDPVALDYSERLLNELNWHGVAMVEFKVDMRDSSPKLMEINGRFWGSLQLAIDSGVDFPALLAQSVHSDIQPDYTYKSGVLSRWFWGDFDALLLRMIKNKNALQLPPDSPGKLSYFVDFIKLWRAGQHYEVLRISDIKPWLFETYQWLKSNIKRVLSRHVQ